MKGVVISQLSSFLFSYRKRPMCSWGQISHTEPGWEGHFNVLVIMPNRVLSPLGEEVEPQHDGASLVDIQSHLPGKEFQQKLYRGGMDFFPPLRKEPAVISISVLSDTKQSKT